MSTKTPNYQLNQWEPSDQFLRTDFNEDNAKIDAALKANADAISAEASARAAGDRVIPKVAVGSYTGNGAETQTISLGFTPKAVLVFRQNGTVGFFSGSYSLYGGLALAGCPVKLKTEIALQIASQGFQVYYKEMSGDLIATNKKDNVYNYIAIA